MSYRAVVQIFSAVTGRRVWVVIQPRTLAQANTIIADQKARGLSGYVEAFSEARAA